MRLIYYYYSLFISSSEFDDYSGLDLTRVRSNYDIKLFLQGTFTYPLQRGLSFFFTLSFYLFILPSFARGLRALLYCIVLNYKNLLKYMSNFSVAFT